MSITHLSGNLSGPYVSTHTDPEHCTFSLHMRSATFSVTLTLDEAEAFAGAIFDACDIKAGADNE